MSSTSVTVDTTDSNKKRKYVPETADFDEDRTQCSDDNDIFDSKMYSQPLDDQQEDENKNKDSSTYTEKNSLSTISVVDLHGSTPARVPCDAALAGLAGRGRHNIYSINIVSPASRALLPRAVVE
ncbi:hypothetical protein SFRURICE_005942 [Spodoptera frugiperda]|nr:hypothetical protein SFRURICE_005942 [Spodoptera frugiperda]